jgi:hypothetical protein
MYINERMRPVETIPEKGRMMEEVNSTMIYMVRLL